MQIRKLIDREEGFSVIEVLAAFSVLAIVTLGTVPLFITGLRSSLVAKLDTGAKNLSQERFEIMRNLAFHIELTDQAEVPTSANCTPPNRTDPRTSGIVVCTYRDLLDTYYRSRTTATSATTGGYVDASSALRTTDEPAGSFYRFVVDPVPGFNDKYRQVIVTQFLDSTRTPVSPATDYNSQVVAKDLPRTRLLGVTVITSWTAGNLSKKFSAFSQITESRVARSAVVLQSRSLALRVTGTLDAERRQLKLEVGASNSDGGISTGGNAATQVNGATAEIVGGARIEGISGSASAPPNFALADNGTTDKFLDDSGTRIAQFVNTKIANVKAAVTAEQPIIGDGTVANPEASPSLGKLTTSGLGVGLNPRLGFFNKPDLSPLNPMPDLNTSFMLVRMDNDDADKVLVEGSSYLRADAGGAHRAVSGAAAFTRVVKLLPTTFAPDGVVQVELQESSLTCTANGSASSSVAKFTAVVKVFTYNPSGSGYTTVKTVVQGQSVSPLDTATLDSTQVGVDSFNAPIFLSRYIATWGSATGNATIPGTTPRRVQRDVNGIVSISTQPVRAGDLDSNIGISFAILSCSAEDNR
ncbi:MAG: hypothetical protein ABIS18_06130 [Actinomycetota bacterium]